MEKKFFVTYTFIDSADWVSDIKTKEILVDVNDGVSVNIIHDALIDTINVIDEGAVTILSWSEIEEAEKPTIKSDNNDCAEYRQEPYYPYMYDSLRSKVFDLKLNGDILNRAITDRANLLTHSDVDTEKYHEITDAVKTLLEKKYDLMYAIKMGKDCTEDLYKRLVENYDIDEALLAW